MARITSGPFCVLRRLARAQQKNHRPLFFFIQPRLSGNLLRRRSPLIQMLDDKTGGDQLVYPAGQLAVLFFHSVGKSVADALALLLVVAHRPALLPVLIHLPALLRRGGVDGMLGGEQQRAAGRQRPVNGGEQRRHFG